MMAEDAQPTSGDAEVERDANRYIEEARKLKAQWDVDLREAYFFAAPLRWRYSTSASEKTARPQDAGELNISFAMEMSTDFGTVVMNALMPEAQQWALRQPGVNVPAAVKDLVADQIKADDEKIFAQISASNFYSECTKSFNPDIAVGTVAMWIEDERAHEPVECIAIPISELELLLGPKGQLDFRAHVQHVAHDRLKTLIPGVPLPEAIADKIRKKPRDKVELRRCLWRVWEDETDVVWQYAIMVGKKLVKAKRLRGAGSCPLIAARFNPMAEWPWGNGPLLQTLPDLRVLDELTMKKIMAIDMSLIPPTGVPDTSFVNFEEGIEAGMVYPIRPGDEGAVKAIYDPPPQNAAIYEKQDLEARIKRMFFLDWPEQRGDTPPSATQWVDQIEMAQRRLGTPAMPFWKEFCSPVVERFAFILERRGVIKPVRVDGKNVSLTPYNPAKKAAEMQEVANAAKAISLCAPTFAQEWPVVVDGATTIKNFVDKLGAEKIIAMRDPNHVAGAVDMISKLAGIRPAAPSAGPIEPSAAPQPTAGGTAPAPAQLMIRSAA